VKLLVASNTAVGVKVAVWGIVGQSGVTSSGNGVRSNVASQEFPLSALSDVGIGLEEFELKACMDSKDQTEASYPTSTVLFTQRQSEIVMVMELRAKTTAKPCWAVLLKSVDDQLDMPTRREAAADRPLPDAKSSEF
jgi:hypothetical protein